MTVGAGLTMHDVHAAYGRIEVLHGVDVDDRQTRSLGHLPAASPGVPAPSPASGA